MLGVDLAAEVARACSCPAASRYLARHRPSGRFAMLAIPALLAPLVQMGVMLGSSNTSCANSPPAIPSLWTTS